MVMLKKLDAFKKLGEEQGKSFSALLKSPEEMKSFSDQYDKRPPAEIASELYLDLIQPHLNYTSKRPFNDLQHRFAATGAGSSEDSAWKIAEADKNYAMRSEDISNLKNLTGLVKDSNEEFGNWVSRWDKAATHAREAIGDPLKTESNIMEPAFNRQDRKAYDQGILDQNNTEAALKLADSEMQQNQMIYNLQEKDRQIQQAESQQLANEIYQFNMLSKDIGKMSAQERQQYELLKENIWANRIKIITLLQQEGRIQEAHELEKATRDKQEFLQTVALIGKVGLSVGLAATGNVPAAAAIWTPNVANYFGQNSAGGKG